MENEPILLKCLAGRLDNPSVSREEKQYIIQRIRDNDLADIRDALVSEPDRPESLRKAIMGPLPTQAEIDVWLAEWGDHYLPLLNPQAQRRTGCALVCILAPLVVGVVVFLTKRAM